MKFTKKCNTCNNIQKFKHKNSLNIAIKNNSSCYSCTAKKRDNSKNWKKFNEDVKKGIKKAPFQDKKHKPETIIKFKNKNTDYLKTDNFKKTMSNATSGKNNPMYGKTVYNSWLTKYGKKIADEKLINLKKKISKSTSGKNNPMYGKSSPKGSGNGWSGWYKNFYFRSLLELSYLINVIERFKFKWISAEKKKYRIKYKDSNNVEKTYVADFILNDKYMIEIKPKKLMKTKSNLEKFSAAKRFCKDNDLIFKVIEPKKLDKKIIDNLYKNNLIKFIKKYDERYKISNNN